MVAGCVSELAPVAELEVDLERIAASATPLTEAEQQTMNGVYAVEHGEGLLGDTVVGRWINNRFCLHSTLDVMYAELAGGWTDGSITLGGYVRIVRSGRGTNVQLEGSLNPGIIVGSTTDDEPITLLRVRDHYSGPRRIHVLAHRGGGRNSERLGISENSIEMVRYAATLGATGVEIDLKRTRDGKVIVFHDETFSPRTVKGAYLLGKVSAFRLADIQRYGQLIYGERIPSLDEMLEAIVDSTALSLVWLDVKDASAMDEILRSQQAAIDHARRQGRQIEILVGIPSQDVYQAFKRNSLSARAPFLYELDANTALAHPDCRAWAPRWTNGIPSSQIAAFHAQGKLVFTWTLDVRDYIADFLYGSDIDGILTNYPSLVSAMHYVRR